MRAYYARNPEKMRNFAKKARARNIEYYRAYDRARGYRVYDPVKVKARRAAAALPPSPCEVCGAVAERHHDDYTKPLEVRWLCKVHHGEEHRIFA